MRCPAALFALTFLATGPALAQAVTRPTVTASAGALRATRGYDDQGRTSGGFATVTALAVTVGGETPVYRAGAVTGSAGARLVAASYGLGFGDGTAFGGDLGLQRLDVYGRLGTDRASARLGASVDLGRGLYDASETASVNSDGQHALTLQLRGEAPRGALRLFAQADGSLALKSEIELLYTAAGDPDEVTPYAAELNTGHLFGFQAGATVPVGSVTLGLAVFYAGRTDGSLRFTDGAPPVPPGAPTGPSDRLLVEYGYATATGVVPSVEYRVPGGALTVRAEGAFSDLYSMEGVPVGITLLGERGPETRPAVTVSASVGL